MGDGLPFLLGTRDSAFHQYQQAVATGLLFLPAAGNRNDSDLNNAGSIGNYWSSTQNPSNANNAYNLNFNSGNTDWNNNNRNNGQSVRPVVSTYHLYQQWRCILFFFLSKSLIQTLLSYCLNYNQLFADLHTAYYDARRHKRKKPYQRRFEKNAEENLQRLCDELWLRTYTPGPSTCFIITDPKQREVFAAQFRDRIVHHLYYNYVHEMLERTFIVDSYSCIKKRGTHFGIRRLEGHIRKESQNYSEPCYVLKMDIRGYFMHINRQRLLDITLASLWSMADHKVAKGENTRWCDIVDMDFVEYLSRTIIMLNPVEGCRRKGNLRQWEGLSPDKSLFYSNPGCGLPIGNLTSQLFSNVYLNELDQYVKRQLHCRHYGRYVDDFYVVSADKDWLRSVIKPVTKFLRDHLFLDVNEEKTIICDVRQGVSFLGAYLKPHRRYVCNSTLHRLEAKVPSLQRKKTPELLRSSLNSFLGLLSHYRSYHIRRRLFYDLCYVYRYGHYLQGMRKYVFNYFLSER